MKTEIFEMNGKGGLTKVDTSKFSDLEPGTVLLWGGNMAWGETRYCILSRTAGSYGTSYKCYNMDKPENNALLHHTEAHSIKDPNDPAVWHSQHMFLQPETVDAETVEKYRLDHARQAKTFKEHNDDAKAEADRLEAIGRELWPRLIGDCQAVIIAEHEKNTSDSQSDYFGSETTQRVILAPSKHKRDLFPEMRKAADLIEETKHLGTGKGRFLPYVEISQNFVSNGSCYYEGSHSHWHQELDKDEHYSSVEFTTLEEAEAYTAAKGDPNPISFDGLTVEFAWKIGEDEIEHREKYSMGHGYYLGHSRYSGWQVSKEVFYKGAPERAHYIDLAKRHDHLEKSGE